MEHLFGTSNTQWGIGSAESMIAHLETMWDDWYNQHKRRLFT